MTPDPGALARKLLELEGVPDARFGPCACDLVGARWLALYMVGPTGTPAQFLEGSHLPAGEVSRQLPADLDACASPTLFAAAGSLRLFPPPFRGLPRAGASSGAEWCLAGVTPDFSVAGFFYGQGEPPLWVVEDQLLQGALLRRLGERAGQSSDPRDALGRLSHEFKTPLVSIKGYAELILDQRGEELSPRAREWVRRIAAAANRLAGICRKATAEERSQSECPFEPRRLGAAVWLERALDEVKVLAGERRLEWRTSVATDAPAVLIDPDAGREVLLELMQNAVRATPDGGTVELLCRREERLGVPGLRLSVVDSGVGVPAGPASQNLFERFVTLTPVLSHHSGEFEYGACGLGLGLSQVRSVVEAHGGSVWAEGRGRDPHMLPGATFCLWLPACMEEPGDGAAAVTDAGRPGRLLLVEPEPELQQILGAALGERFEVEAAGSAEEAVALAADGAWEACVVEPRVGGDGVALLRDLRAAAGLRDASILAYSLGAGPGESSAWRAAGADGCVAKPARTRVLIQRLQTLRARRSRR